VEGWIVRGLGYMRRTSTSISTFTDNTGRVIKADVEVTQEGTGIHRTFTVERGGVFRPEPLNPRKKGHWGRVATVLGFRSIDSGLYVILRFADDGSKGYALAEELVEVNINGDVELTQERRDSVIDVCAGSGTRGKL